MTVFNIAQCLGNAYPLAFTPRNITSGFRATGIRPYNRDIFSDDDFGAANVTDRGNASFEQLTTSSANTAVNILTESLDPAVTEQPASPDQQTAILQQVIKQPTAAV